MKKLIILLLFIPFILAAQNPLRLPYQTLLQTYSGDTSKVYFSGDSVKWYTNQIFFQFNKSFVLPSGKIVKVGTDTLTKLSEMREYVSTHSGVGDSTVLKSIYQSHLDTTKLHNQIIAKQQQNNVNLIDASSSNQSITLPTAVGHLGYIYIIKKIDSSSHTVTINTTSSQTIDGYSSIEFSYQYQTYTVVSNGSNWFIISIL
jgi:hypothetical protein